jgi:peptidyl-tRNA hydrolase, PTH2 family
MVMPVFLPPDEDFPQVVEERINPTTPLSVIIGARDVKQVIVIRKDLRMRRGKEIAQGAHASLAWLSKRMMHNDQTAIVRLSDAERQWLMTRFRKVTLQVNSEDELSDIYDSAEKRGLEVHMITDAGLTEFPEPTVTCLAIGPDYDDLIDPVTETLRTY